MTETLPAVVGVDGGNSKTDLVLALVDGTVLARVRGAGTRSPAIGAGLVAGDLAVLLGRAWNSAQREPSRLASAVFHLANIDLPSEERSLTAALQRFDLAERVAVGNDTLAVLRAGSPQGWGVAVVCGTGINALGLAPDGRLERYLGLGTISGDWGGGSSIAREALFHAVRAEDGRGVPTLLRSTLPAHFDLTEPSEVALAVHEGRITTIALAGACPIVFAAAHAGDDVARSLVIRAGRECAAMAAGLLRRLGTPPAQTPLVLGGSVLQSRDPILSDAFGAEMARRQPRASWVTLDAPPVAGSLDAALLEAGASEASRARARAELVRWTP